MKNVQIQSHTGKQIRSFIDWEKHALPPDRKELHWKGGRSAFELGRSWTLDGAPSVPFELARILDSHEGTRGTVVLSGITEHETTLPFSSRGARCHDLALRAEQEGCAVTICVEAKADEPFGGTVAEEIRKARKRPTTRFPQRLDWLTRSLLGIPAFMDGHGTVLCNVIANLPYQLLSGVAGTLLEAKLQRSTKAVFLVHEFRTMETVDAKLIANANALNSFLRLLKSTNQVSGEEMTLEVGQIIGPISIVERPVAGTAVAPSHVPLFVGKLRTDRLV
jgi:hypothetical protein